MTKNNLYCLIDLSYFTFYRYYALIGWWKLAQPDIELGNPIENEIIRSKKLLEIDNVDFVIIFNSQTPLYLTLRPIITTRFQNSVLSTI